MQRYTNRGHSTAFTHPSVATASLFVSQYSFHTPLCCHCLPCVTVQLSHTPLLPLPPLYQPVLSTVVRSLVRCTLAVHAILKQGEEKTRMFSVVPLGLHCLASLSAYPASSLSLV